MMWVIGLTALMTTVVVVIGFPLFLIWIVRNAVHASKYRASVKSGIGLPKTGYTVVYKTGRKMESLDLDGDTESEAMRDLVKKGIRYDKIVSLTKK